MRVTPMVRDLWLERNRAALAIVAMAIGIAGFFAVLGTYAILTRELNRGYLATNPASAILVTDAIDQPLLDAVIARDDVEDAEARRLIRARIRVRGGLWKRLALYVMSDLHQTRISIVTREQSTRPILPGDILIERDAFEVAGAHVGDDVEIQLQPGMSRTLRVAGGIHDVGQAQARMEDMVYGYITPATLPLLGERATLDRLYLVVSGDRFDQAHVQQVAEAVKASLEGAGHGVARVIVPTPGEHPHAAIMGLLLLAISTLGLLILAISGVIVFTIMLASVARRRRQIGLMKAIGGTRGQIAIVYLAQSAALGLGAISVGVPIGLAGNRTLASYLARLLNFDLTSYAIPLWVYGAVAVVGIATPLLAAALPVARGTAIPVRAALDPAGATIGARRSSPAWLAWQVEAMLTRVIPPSVPRAVMLGLQNLLRRPGRVGLSLIMLSLAGASYMTALNTRAAMIAAVDAMFGAGTFGSADRYAFDQHMLMIYVFLLIAATVLALIGSLAMTTVTSLNVLDRRREIGVVRAIGASPSSVIALVVSEAAFVAGTSVAIGVMVAWPLSAMVGRLLTAILFRRGLHVTLSLPGIVSWLLIAAVVSVAASIVPAWHTARRPIREAVSYD